MSWLILILFLFGLFFVLVAAIGVLRLPDFYSRTHAAAKAGAFGGSLILVAVALAFGSGWVAFKVVLIILFFYATTPVASHMVGRAAYLRKTRRWEGTQCDEISGKYRLKDRTLEGWKPE